MKRVFLVVMCLLASLQMSSVNAQEKQSKLVISPFGLASVIRGYPLSVNVIYENVDNIKVSGKNIEISDKVNENEGMHLMFNRSNAKAQTNPDRKSKMYELVSKKFGLSEFKVRGVAANGEKLEKMLYIFSGSGKNNDDLALNVPNEIVKQADKQQFTLKFDKQTKYVLVYYSGIVIYKKVSNATELTVDLDLSKVTRSTQLSITVCDENYNSMNTSVQLKVE